MIGDISRKKMTVYAVVFSVAALALTAAKELTLPVTTCKRNSTNYNSCLKLAIEEAWPRFVQGIPELDFPRLDPFSFHNERVTFTYGDTHGEGILKNGVTKGTGNVQFTKVESDITDDSFYLSISLIYPKIYMDSDLEMMGSIVGLRLNGKGHFNFTAETVKMVWDMKGHIVNDRLIIEYSQGLPTIDKFTIKFKDFFDGNEELNNLATLFGNEYWPTLYRLTYPEISKSWNTWFINLTSTLFSKVSFSKTFP